MEGRGRKPDPYTEEEVVVFVLDLGTGRDLLTGEAEPPGGTATRAGTSGRLHGLQRVGGP